MPSSIEQDVLFGHGKTVNFLVTRLHEYCRGNEWASPYTATLGEYRDSFSKWPEFRAPDAQASKPEWFGEPEAAKSLRGIQSVIDITLSCIKNHEHPEIDQIYYDRCWAFFDTMRQDFQYVTKPRTQERKPLTGAPATGTLA